ncbi:activating signal cointegrator 1 complex subunit 2-like isoform X1 [Dreissena polymorpha]|uniref:CUE domain-containing protein n=1 Tax=Dreissena polymorpha TaxID=45954 RepID=A0A9D4H1R1_DREPO|nr:activating signal cointegrator 1 complex subunit 2-like isoform X1 [Dreissena polymorpha]KAH3826782.1 hypothetical protein DPMN_128694 [Dreissena polymorpha]
MSVPLDKQKILLQDGKSKQSVPALDPRWMEEVQFVGYQAPPIDLSDKGQYEEWLERLKFIEDDLHWLLQLPHGRFWCQAIFDESLHRCIDSYLRYAPRSYETVAKLPSSAKKSHDEVHRLVFLTCMRMSTYKESKEHHITPSVFGEILYENFLYDIPKLLDLCVLYGQGNQPLLARMIENIFTQQPKYNDDLAGIVGTLSEVFDNIMAKCGIHPDPGSQTPQKLGDQGNIVSLVTMATGEFNDIILYLSDIGMTLTSFLNVYPPACMAFHGGEFLVKLPAFYGAVVPEVFATLKQKEQDISTKKALKQKLTQAKTNLLEVFKTVVYHCCIQPLLEKRAISSDYIEDYLHIMSGILNDRRFLADYEGIHSFQGDIDILLQAGGDIDETRIQYIKEAVNLAFATFGKRKAPKGAMNRGGRKSPDGSPSPLEGGASGVGTLASCRVSDLVPADAYQVEDYDSSAVGACATLVTGVELESLITSVKDLLPELGEGFIELCLEELGYDMERVINSMLEDRLPASLRDLDRQLPRKQRAATPPSLVHERKNIYDFDEFDVFHRDDVDTRKIRRGKADKSESVVIGDQSELRDIKDAISKDYGIVVDVVEDDGRGHLGSPRVAGVNNEGYARDMYEDEYDDTYDTNVVGADDADSADELTTIRPFTVPRVLGGGQSRDSPRPSYEESEESEEEDPGKKRDLFLQDPAELRERAAERAHTKANRNKQGQGGGQRSEGKSQGSGQGGKTYDVKGGPKGQGQSQEVLRNRRWKTQHKGDHRKALADKKRRV